MCKEKIKKENENEKERKTQFEKVFLFNEIVVVKGFDEEEQEDDE